MWRRPMRASRTEIPGNADEPHGEPRLGLRNKIKMDEPHEPNWYKNEK